MFIFYLRLPQVWTRSMDTFLLSGGPKVAQYNHLGFKHTSTPGTHLFGPKSVQVERFYCMYVIAYYVIITIVIAM